MRIALPRGLRRRKRPRLPALVVWFVVAAMVGIARVTSADEPAAFQRAGVNAPAGYVAYAVRIWGARASGRFSAAGADEFGRLSLRSEAGDDGRVGPTTVDAAVESVIYLPQAFTPSAELLALRVRRPVDFGLPAGPPEPFTLRLIGDDPADPAYRLYETSFAGTVVSGTVTGFELNAATVERGYPYRGPLVYRGWTKRRPARSPGEKSVIRIPIGAAIPEILLYRP